MLAVQKKLPAAYFQDRRGAALLEELARQPEHYLTRAERGLITEWAPSLAARIQPRTLVELTVGNVAAARMPLDLMRRAGARVAHLQVDVCGGLPGPLPLTSDLPRPILVTFLGAGIGGFHHAAAVKLLLRVHAALQADDRLLLSADLRTDHSRLSEACNDAAGIGAELNRNVLRVANARLGTDFDPDGFTHRAFYNHTARRVEIHLVSRRRQAVTIPGVGVVELEEGETIRTGISCTYDRHGLHDLLADAGFLLDDWRSDGEVGVGLGAPIV